jgi:hypothetical protein
MGCLQKAARRLLCEEVPGLTNPYAERERGIGCINRSRRLLSEP